jgi:VIT1/CCC1 family predicted Fe2+/Mn2+ transporter
MSAVHEALARVQKMLLSDAGISPGMAYNEISATLRTQAERIELSRAIDSELAAGRMRPAGSGSLNHGGRH